MNYFKKLVFLFCLAQTLPAWTQDNEKISKLKEQASSSVDTVRALLYSDLCYEYRFISQDSAIAYGNKAIQLAQQSSFKKGIAQGMNDLGIIYTDQNNVKKSLALYDAALSIRITLKDTAGQGSLYNKIGIIHQKTGALDLALKNQLNALKIFENINHKYGAAQCLNNIAIIYFDQGRLEDALNYYDQSLEIKTSIGDQYGIAGTLANIGNIYYQQKDFKRAISKTKESIEILRAFGQNEYLAAGLNNLGAMQQEANLQNDARKSIQESLEIRTQLNDEKGMSSCLINLASVHIFKREFSSAKRNLDQAYAIAKRDELKFELKQIYIAYRDLFRKEQRFALALSYTDSILLIHETIFNEESNQKILELQTQYETEKKEKEIAFLAIQNQLKDTEISHANNRFYATGSGTILLLLVIGLSFNRFKHKQRAILAEEKSRNQKLGFKSLIEGEEKERKRIAQDLHDGLGQLLSSARLNVSAMEDNFEEVVTVQWNNSIKLIDDAVTEVRTISHNMMPNALISIGFEAALREQIHIINDAGSLKVHFAFPEEKIDLPESESIALYRVIQEIINNALKYSEAQNIWLEITNQESINVIIKDDGKGFDTNLVQNSTGIGWQNIHSRVDILNGAIDIESKLGEGSKISLKIAV